MEQLIIDIRAHSKVVKLTPSTVIQYYGGYGSTVWDKWVSGKAACTMPMAERIRAKMREAERDALVKNSHDFRCGASPTIIQGEGTDFRTTVSQ